MTRSYRRANIIYSATFYNSHAPMICHQSQVTWSKVHSKILIGGENPTISSTITCAYIVTCRLIILSFQKRPVYFDV